MGGDSLLSIKKSSGTVIPRRTLRHLPHNRAEPAMSGFPRGTAFSSVRAAVAILFLATAFGCGSESDAPLGPDPTRTVMSFDEALALAQQQKFDEAIAGLRPFVSKPNPSTQELMVYARTLIGANRNSLAVWPLQRAIEREDAPPIAPLLYTQTLLAGGDELAAIEFATEWLDENPDDLRFLDARSQAYQIALDLERAAEDLEIVVDENPDRAKGVERLLNLLLELEDWDSARNRIAQLEELLSRPGVAPSSRTNFCSSAAQFELERGNPEVAEAKLDACLAEAPADLNLVAAKELLLDQTERSEEATAFLAGLAEEYPKRQLIQQSYAGRLGRLGRLDEAEAVLVAAAEGDNHPNSWISLANLRLALKDLDGTVDAMDKAIEAATELSPDDPALEWAKMDAESRFGIGDVYVRAGKMDRAERIIDSLREDELAMALLLDARVKLEAGDPAAALVDYHEAFKTFPSNAAARYLAGRAAVETGDFDLAIDLYQDALRADPVGTDAGIVLAQMLMAEGRINWALDALSFQMARGGSPPFVARIMARAAAAGAMHGFAEGLRAEMAKDSQWAGLALADQARDIVIMRDASAAREYLAGSEKLFEPSHYEAMWTWIKLALGTEAEAEARERESTHFASNRDSAGAQVVRGRLLFEDGKKEEALLAFQKAAEADPLSPSIHADLGETLLSLDRIEEGIASLDRARDLEPREPRYWFAAAKGLYDAERYEEAIARVDELLIPHPWHGRAALVKLDAARKLGRSDDDDLYLTAQRAARYHVISGPQSFLELARFDLARGEYESALAGFERTAVAVHDVANARFGIGQALAKLGRRKEAIEQIELALTSKELDEPIVATALLDELKAEETTQ